MANAGEILSRLVVQISGDADGLSKTLETAKQQVSELTKQLQDGGKWLDALAQDSSFAGMAKAADAAIESVKKLNEATASADEQTRIAAFNQLAYVRSLSPAQIRAGAVNNYGLAAALLKVGNNAQLAAFRTRALYEGLDNIGRGVIARIKGLAGPLVAAFGMSKIWSGFVTTGTALQKLSERVGISAQELDAWGKANASAGGTADDFYRAMIKWTGETGQSAREFLQLGERVRGLDRATAEMVLKQMGIQGQARAVFVKYRGDAEKAAEAMKKFAITDEQARQAKEYSGQWKTFTMYAQSLGNTIMSMVVPALTVVVKKVGDFTAFLKEHEQFVQISVRAIGLAFAILAGRRITGAIGTLIRTFGKLRAAFGLVKAGFIGMTMVFRANPLAVLITAFELLSFVLDDVLTFAQGGKSVLGSFLEWLGVSAGTVDTLRGAITAVVDWVKYLLALLGAGEWGKALNFLANSFMALWNGIGEGFAAFIRWIGRGIINWLTRLSLTIAHDVGGWVDDLVGFAKDAVEGIGAWFSGIGAKIQNAWNAVVNYDYWGFLEKSLDDAWTWIVDKFKGLPAAIGRAISGLGASVADSFKDSLPGWMKKVLGISKEDSKTKAATDYLGSNEAVQTLNAMRQANDNRAGPITGQITNYANRTQATTTNNTKVEVNFNGNVNDPAKVRDAVAAGVQKASSPFPSAGTLATNGMTGTMTK